MLNVFYLFISSIWKFLQDLTSRGKTIIITTHYIEEARQANMVRPYQIILNQNSYINNDN